MLFYSNYHVTINKNPYTFKVHATTIWHIDINTTHNKNYNASKGHSNIHSRRDNNKRLVFKILSHFFKIQRQRQRQRQMKNGT